MFNFFQKRGFLSPRLTRFLVSVGYLTEGTRSMGGNVELVIIFHKNPSSLSMCKSPLMYKLTLQVYWYGRMVKHTPFRRSFT